MLQLVVYVPFTHKEQVKQALFEQGLGKQGDYDCCAFEYSGRGQFRPLNGATPYIGQADALATVDEVKIEMLCPEPLASIAVSTLKQAHPYEEPAFHFLSIWLAPPTS